MRRSLLPVLLLLPVTVFAHPGDLDQDGCHEDPGKQGFHCHSGSPASDDASTMVSHDAQAVDGDTIQFPFKGKTVMVDVFGVDCPEMKQPYGLRAEQFMASMLFGEFVRVRVLGHMVGGRALGVVYIGDLDLSKELIGAGLGWWDQIRAPKAEEHKKLELEARAAKRGLWAGENPVAPWKFRGSPSRPALRAGTASNGGADGKRGGLKHWNSGIIHFQKLDYKKAKAEWEICLTLDPANADCQAGLTRLRKYLK
ncbi:MAG: thermonuclease family protein [Elusimicrobiota bacterium]